RRDRLAVAPEPRACGAVADREDRIVAARLQRRPHNELIDAIGFESVEIAQEIGSIYSRGPDDEFGVDEFTAREAHASGKHLGHARPGVDGDLHPLEEPRGS